MSFILVLVKFLNLDVWKQFIQNQIQDYVEPQSFFKLDMLRNNPQLVSTHSQTLNIAEPSISTFSKNLPNLNLESRVKILLFFIVFIVMVMAN